MDHLERLNIVAKKHGLPFLSGGMSPTIYLGYAVDLMMVELGLLQASDISPPKDAFR